MSLFKGYRAKTFAEQWADHLQEEDRAKRKTEKSRSKAVMKRAKKKAGSVAPLTGQRNKMQGSADPC